MTLFGFHSQCHRKTHPKCAANILRVSITQTNPITMYSHQISHHNHVYRNLLGLSRVSHQNHTASNQLD